MFIGDCHCCGCETLLFPAHTGITPLKESDVPQWVPWLCKDCLRPYRTGAKCPCIDSRDYARLKADGFAPREVVYLETLGHSTEGLAIA